MKVVLMHDWLTGFRGGERMLEAFCEMFPEAPLYTLIHQKGSVPESIENRKIVTSFLNDIPGIHQHYRKFLPLFPRAAESLKIVEKADLVISSSHCVIKGVRKPEESVHLSYVYSPMRYLYDQFDNYFGPESPWLHRWGMKVFRSYLTNWDLQSNQNVDHLIAISDFVRQRIQKYYALPSSVVYPFVDFGDFLLKEPMNKENYYLMVGAFAPNKRVDLAITAFNQLGMPLKIIGSGQEEDKLKAMAKNNIEFLGSRTRSEIVKAFQGAKGFIFPGVEDFGITPLESLASGTPVIARKIGGVLETLNDDVAEFFPDDTPESLAQAVLRFEKRDFRHEELIKRAQIFSKDRFRQEIQKQIETHLK